MILRIWFTNLVWLYALGRQVSGQAVTSRVCYAPTWNSLSAGNTSLHLSWSRSMSDQWALIQISELYFELPNRVPEWQLSNTALKYISWQYQQRDWLRTVSLLCKGSGSTSRRRRSWLNFSSVYGHCKRCCAYIVYEEQMSIFGRESVMVHRNDN